MVLDEMSGQMDLFLDIAPKDRTLKKPLGIYEETDMESFRVRLNERKSLLAQFLFRFKSERTRKTYSFVLKSFFQFLEKNHFPLDEPHIEPVHASLYMEALYRKHVSNMTFRTYFFTLVSYWDFLHRRRQLKSNIFREIGLVVPPGVSERGTADIAAEKAREIIEESKKNPLHYAVFSVFLGTGLRKSELIDLKRKNYFDNGGEFWLMFTTKGRQHRKIKLSERRGDEVHHSPIKKALDEYLAFMLSDGRRLSPDSPLFQPQRESRKDLPLERPLSKCFIDRLVKRYSQTVGAGEISAHSLRKAFINDLLNQGLDIHKVAQIVGHRNIRTTQRYVQEMEEKEFFLSHSSLID